VDNRDGDGHGQDRYGLVVYPADFRRRSSGALLKAHATDDGPKSLPESEDKGGQQIWQQPSVVGFVPRGELVRQRKSLCPDAHTQFSVLLDLDIAIQREFQSLCLAAGQRSPRLLEPKPPAARCRIHRLER